MTEDDKWKIEISPDALQDLDNLTAQEAQKLLDEFKRMVEDGSFLEKSEPVDLDRLAVEDPELYQIIVKRLSAADQELDDEGPTLH